jgi:very-short-patch-repair endonuclease
MGAVLAHPPGAVASHASAGWLWGLVERRPATYHVTTATRGRGRDQIRLHYARLRDEDRGRCDGIPVTAVSRTLLDLAAGLPGGGLDAAIERADRSGLFHLDRVESLLDRSAGHPGRRGLERALAVRREEVTFTRSSLERRFLALIMSAGLPRPSTNVFVEGYEIDAYWPRERFAVERDGYEFHRTRAAFERDRLRQEDLKLAGIEMIRMTWRRIDSEPDRVAGRIRILLERRRRTLDS